MGQHVIESRVLSNGVAITNIQHFHFTVDGKVTDEGGGGAGEVITPQV